MAPIQTCIVEFRGKVEYVLVGHAARVTFVVVIRERARERVEGVHLEALASQICAHGHSLIDRAASGFAHLYAAQSGYWTRLKRSGPAADAEKWTLGRIHGGRTQDWKRQIQLAIALEIQRVDLAVIDPDTQSATQFSLDAATPLVRFRILIIVGP